MAERRTELTDARRMVGHTQESLAEELHVERTTAHRWESGTPRPLPYLWPKLAKLLGRTPTELRDLPNGTKPTPASSDVDRRSALSSGVSMGVLLALGERTSGTRPECPLPATVAVTCGR
ncbi:hypothetical protein GCM10022243_37550 [Saccharothrix violaceirubra]|uniref:helix-turn-helix domain-containing protein n=1 Tax=Saccharothrix violaceirubra TaxID=413306 RepID=UPI001609A9A0